MFSNSNTNRFKVGKTDWEFRDSASFPFAANELRYIRFISVLNKMAPYKVVMVRHGESEWNEKNLFCGWYDANLSAKGNKKILT